ncbi:MAG: GNAT family N-acetyltransferase [Parcubacteria group bacterium]|jgi:ribosomal protein S18 acetylase RimI-like enzyme
MNNIRNKSISAGIKIEKMTRKDLPILFHFGKDQWKKSDWLTMEYLRSSFEQSGPSYVAKIGDDVVGGVIFVYEDIVRNWIRYLIINKKFRRQGVGTALLQKIFEQMKSGESIFVDTGVSDKDAINFYEKCGFKNRGMVKSLYGNEPAYFLEKTFN